MNGLILDIRHVLRSLRRTPGVFLAAVLSIGIGIGVNTVVFSWMDNLVLNPFPLLREPHRLVGIEVRAGDGGAEPVSFPILREWRESSRSFSGMSAWSIARVSKRLAGEAASTSLIAFLTSGNYFDVLGGATILGRALTAEDERSLARVAVLGYECFRREFAADPAVVGNSVYLNGQSVTIVGVAAPGFLGTYLGVVPDLFVPVSMHPALTGSNMLEDRGARSFQVVARLAEGVSVRDADRELDALARRLSGAAGDRPVTGAVVIDVRQRYLGGIVSPLFAAMLVVTALLLLVACANVAGLLLVRATARGGEMSLRLAIGASRRQLARLVLLESALLAVAGAALGVGIAHMTRASLYLFIPTTNYPIILPLALNLRALLGAMALTALVTVLCGALPMLRAARNAPGSALRASHAGTSLSALRVRFGIVGAQIAFTLLCLVTAASFLRGVRSAAAVDPGFDDPAHVLLVNTDLGPTQTTGPAGIALLERALSDVRALPGVEEATVASLVPLGFGGRRTVNVRPEGHEPRPDENTVSLRAIVGAGYAATMRIPIVEGRELDERDGAAGMPVALVNETFAERFWPGTSALGRRFDAGRGPVTIVGVLRDGKYGSLAESPQAVAYFPYAQWPQPSVIIHVRTSGNPLLLAEPVRRAMQRAHADLPALQPRTLAEHIAASLFAPRVGAIVLSAFGAVALVLSAVGLYAAVSFLVALRTRELGIRMALGAGHAAIVRSVAVPIARTTAIGAAAAAALALGLGRVVESRIVFVRPPGALVLTAILALVALTTVVAAWRPARRALRVDAARVLRDG